MCFFVTVAVPLQYADRIGEVFGRGFHTHATANPSVTAALPPGYAARLITSGTCSCDLYARPRSAQAPDPAVHLRRKYQKRGWSEAKIKGALEQAAVKESKTNRATSGFRSDVLSGIEALCRAAGSAALLVHWYSGDIESERFPLGQPRRCKCDELAAQAQSLVEDELLIATAGRTD
jgi:hypothetical protein